MKVRKITKLKGMIDSGVDKAKLVDERGINLVIMRAFSTQSKRIWMISKERTLSTPSTKYNVRHVA